MCPVGHAFDKKLMKEQGVKFGSELSLHHITKICMGWSLQIFRFYIFLRLISGTGKKLSELTAPLNKYFHSGEINFHVDNKEKFCLI